MKTIWDEIGESLNEKSFLDANKTPERLKLARDNAFKTWVEEDPDFEYLHTTEEEKKREREWFNEEYDKRFPHARPDYGELDAVKDFPSLFALGAERYASMPIAGAARFIGEVMADVKVSEREKDLIAERSRIVNELGVTKDIVSSVGSGGPPSVPALMAAHEAREKLTPERKSELEKRLTEIERDISHSKAIARQDTLAWNIAEGIDRWVRDELPLKGSGVFSSRDKVNPGYQETIAGQVATVAGGIPSTMAKAYLLGPQMAMVGLFADNSASLFEESYQSAKGSGATDSEAVQVAMTASIPAALLDTVADVKTVGKIAEKIIGKVTKREAVKELLKAGIIEGSTEVGQDKIMQLATDLYGENVDTGDLFSVEDLKTFLVAAIVGTSAKGAELSLRRARGLGLSESDEASVAASDLIINESIKDGISGPAVDLANEKLNELRKIAEGSGSEADMAKQLIPVYEEFLQDPAAVMKRIADSSEEISRNKNPESEESAAFSADNNLAEESNQDPGIMSEEDILRVSGEMIEEAENGIDLLRASLTDPETARIAGFENMNEVGIRSEIARLEQRADLLRNPDENTLSEIRERYLSNSEEGISALNDTSFSDYYRAVKKGVPLTDTQLRLFEEEQLSSGNIVVPDVVPENTRNQFRMDKEAYLDAKGKRSVLFEPSPEVLGEAYALNQGIVSAGIQKGIIDFFNKISSAREVTKHVRYNDASRGRLLEDVEGNIEAISEEVSRGETVRAFSDSYFTQDISGWDPTGKIIESGEDFAILAMELSNPDRELLKAAFVDERGRIVSAGVLTVGVINGTMFDASRLGALYKNARTHEPNGSLTLYVSHNHPSGVVNPSESDFRSDRITKRYISSLSASESVSYGGHFITNGESYFDLANGTAHSLKNKKHFAWEYADRSKLYVLNTLDRLSGIVNALRKSSPDGRFGIYTNTKGMIVGIKQLSNQASINAVVSEMLLDISDFSANGSFYVGIDKDATRLIEMFTDLGLILHDVSTDKVTSYRSMGLIGPRKNADLSLGENAPDSRDVAMDSGISVKVDGVDLQMKLGGMDTMVPLKFPELVEMSEMLLDGKTPGLKVFSKFRGAFYPGVGQILLNPIVFQNRNQAIRTLSHEIGHAVDWIPDKDMNRGNILGRVASLKGFMKGVVEIDGNILSRDRVTEELKNFSMFWRPWNPETATDSEKNYRNSSVELYADAVSGLLTAPHELRARCPLFWDAWIRTLERKPEVLVTYCDFQMMSGNESLLADRRMARQVAGYRAGWESLLRNLEVNKAVSPEASMEYMRYLFHSVNNKRKDLWLGFLRSFQNRHANAIALEKDIISRMENDGVQVSYENTYQMAVDDYNNKDVSLRLWSHKTLSEMLPALKDAGIDMDSEFGVYLENTRRANVDPDSGTIEILSTEEAQNSLKRLRESMGEERFAKMQLIASKFSDRIYEVMESAKREGLLSPEVWETVNKHRYDYFTFMSIDHINDPIFARIIPRQGTMKKIVNPVFTTLMKMMAVQRWIEYNKISKKLYSVLSASDEVTPAKMINTGKRMIPKDPERGMDILRFWKDGKAQYFYTDRVYTAGLNSSLVDSLRDSKMVGALNSVFQQTFYRAFVGNNPKFLAITSPIRDLGLAWLSQGYKAAGKQTVSYVRNFAVLVSELISVPLDQSTRNKIVDFVLPADPSHPLRASRDFIKGRFDNPLVSEMMEARALFMMNDRRSHSEATSEDLLRMAGYDPKAKSVDESGFKRIVKTVGNAIEYMGATFEQSSRIAAYLEAKESGKSIPLASHFARNYAATPNITRKGEWTRVSNTVFPFSNVAIQALDSRFFGLLFGKDKALGKGSTNAALWRLSHLLMLGSFWTLAEIGMLGGDDDEKNGLKEIFGYIPDSDKANYFCIPYGWSEDEKGRRKAMYFRIPMDETLRMMWGVNRRIIKQLAEKDALDSDLIDASRDILSFGAGQLPGVNPVWTVGKGWYEYTVGENPLDPFTQRPVLSKDEEAMRGSEGIKKMVWWTMKKSGVANFVSYDPYAREGGEISVKESLKNFSGINSVIRESDYGVSEQRSREDKVTDKKRAERRKMLSDNAYNLYREYSSLSFIKKDQRTGWESMRLNELKPFYKAYNRFMESDDANADQVAKWLNEAAENFK